MNRWLDRLIGRVIRHGRLEVTWSDGERLRLRRRRRPCGARRVPRSRAPSGRCCVNPELALGEAYMDGRIEFPGRLRCSISSMLAERELERVPQACRSSRALSRLRFATRRVTQNNSLLRARRNVAHHYDLDGRLYRLFLDSDMQYSCAYFETAGRDARRGAMGEEAPSRRQARAAAGPGGARHRLRLGRARPVPRRVCRRRTSPASRSPTEQHRVSNERAPRARARAAACASSCRTTARSTGTSTASSRSACSSMSARRATASSSAPPRELLKPDGVMVLHSIGRYGPPGDDQSLDRQIHLPRRLHPGAFGGDEGDRAGRPVRHRHRDPAPPLRRDAEGLARALPRQLGRGGARSTTSGSAACGISTSPAPRRRSAPAA